MKNAVFVIVVSSCLKREHVYNCASFLIARLAHQVSALPVLMDFLFLRMAIIAIQLVAGILFLSMIPAYLVLLPSPTASLVPLCNQEWRV